MLGMEASNHHFWVFSMTRTGIEPVSEAISEHSDLYVNGPMIFIVMIFIERILVIIFLCCNDIYCNYIYSNGIYRNDIYL